MCRVTSRTLQPVSVLSESYVRRTGRLGLQGTLADGAPDAEAARLVVPGYLLSHATGSPLPDGSLGALLPEAKGCTLDLVPLPAGRYRLHLEPPNENVDVRLSVRTSGKSPGLRPEGTGEFSLLASEALRLEVHPPRLTTLVGRIIIERTAPPGWTSRP